MGGRGEVSKRGVRWGGTEPFRLQEFSGFSTTPFPRSLGRRRSPGAANQSIELYGAVRAFFTCCATMQGKQVQRAGAVEQELFPGGQNCAGPDRKYFHDGQYGMNGG